MKYITLAQYQSSADGIVTKDLTDLSLAHFIQRAESDIDAYIGFDMNSGGGFEPHTVWKQSTYDEVTRKTPAPDTLVPQRRILRYRIQVSNLPTAGAGFFANIQPSDCAINVTHGYVEIVPLQSVTYSLAPVLMGLGLKPPIVQTDIEVGFYLPHWKETLFPAGGGVYASTRTFWAMSYDQSLATQPNTVPSCPPVVYVNGVSLDPSQYDLNAIEGQVTLHQPLPGNPVIQCDFTATIPDNVVSSTIARTTYLLAQARLNAQGLLGLELIKTGDQMISRGTKQVIQGVYGNLDELSAGYLAAYVPIAVG